MGWHDLQPTGPDSLAGETFFVLGVLLGGWFIAGACLAVHSAGGEFKLVEKRYFVVVSAFDVASVCTFGVVAIRDGSVKDRVGECFLVMQGTRTAAYAAKGIESPVEVGRLTRLQCTKLTSRINSFAEVSKKPEYNQIILKINPIVEEKVKQLEARTTRNKNSEQKDDE